MQNPSLSDDRWEKDLIGSDCRGSKCGALPLGRVHAAHAITLRAGTGIGDAPPRSEVLELGNRGAASSTQNLLPASAVNISIDIHPCEAIEQ